MKGLWQVFGHFFKRELLLQCRQLRYLLNSVLFFFHIFKYLSSQSTL